MTHQPSDPFGSIPIAGEEKEGEARETTQQLPPAAEERPQAGKPVSSPPLPRHSRLKRARRTSDRWRRRLTWLAVVPAIGFVLYLLAGYLLVPYLLGSVLPSRLARILDRPVTVGAASFNPFTLSVTLRDGIIGPRLTDPAEGIDPLLSFGRLKLDLAVAGIPKRGLICEEVTADRLVIHLVRRQDGTYNLQELLPPATDRFRISLNNISIRNSRLLFDDRPTGATHEVEEINLTLPSLANIDYRPERFLSPRFAAKVDGSPLLLTGETRTNEKGSEARLTLRLKQLDLPRFFAYLPLDADFIVSKGRADLDLNLLIQTGEQTDTRLQIEGTGKLTDVWLQSADGGKELARLPTAKGVISFAPLRGSYRLKELVLQQPELFLERDADGHWLLPRLTAASGTKVEIDRLLVSGGRLAFLDRRVKGGFSDTWTDLSLTIDGLTSDSGKQATFAFSGHDKDQTRLSAQGRLYQKPLRAEGILVGHQLQLAAFNPYLEEARGLRIREGAEVSKVEAEFTADSKKAGFEFSLRKLAAHISGLSLARQQKEWLRLPEIAVKDAAMDWPGRRLVLGDLEAAGGFLFLDWDKEGRLNGGSSREGAGKWQVAVKAAALKELTLRLRTKALQEPLTLELQKTAATLTDMSTSQDSEGHLQVSGSLFGESPVELAGTLGVAPFVARLKGRVKDLSVLRLQPLFTGWFRPLIRRGSLQADGELRLPEGIFRGSAHIDDFAAAPLDDKDQDILRCQQANSPELTVDFRSGIVRAAAVTLDQPFAAWTLTGKGSSSLDELWNLSWTKADDKPRLALDRVVIRDGKLAFSDPGASPLYATTATGVAGSITSLTSTADSRSRITFAGQIGQAPFSVQGTLQPFAEKSAAEIQAELHDFPIVSLSPYLRKQLGYRLAGGTIDLTASLHLTAGHLQATNHFQAAGITLGDVLDRSSRLPLTVALLADRNDHIEIDIPVTGDPEDPAFSYREELRRPLRNLLLRTAVSPFSFLAAAAPNAGLQEYLSFPQGGANLTPRIEKQLQALARVLTDRPQLKLILKGFAGSKDRQAIKAREEAEEKVQQLAREMQQTGKLTAAYGKEEIRLPSSPPVSKSTPQRIEVNDEMLKELAGNRSKNIKRYLIGLGLPPDRVAIAPAGGPTAADAPGRPGSRVEIGLEALRS